MPLTSNQRWLPAIIRAMITIGLLLLLWLPLSPLLRSNSGRTVFYSSALTGTVAAAGISNLYYPAQDRGFGHTVSRITIDLGNTALYNAAAEFWPDIHRKLQHIF